MTAKERRSASDVARDRAAVRDFLPAVAGVLVLQGSLIVFDPDRPASLGTLAWSLSPIIPVLWIVWAQWRSLRRADDYQRTQELEALALGFAVMIVGTFVGTILDAAELGSARQSLQITQAVGLVAWIGVRGWKLRPRA